MPTRNILCLGDSLTAGYGLPSSQSFPFLLQQKIIAHKLPYRVINGGLSGDTSAGGLLRLEKYLTEPVDVFLLELGINDLFRGIHPLQTGQNLQKIINRVREVYPKSRLVIAGIDAPVVLNIPFVDELANAFRKMIRELAQHNHAAFIPSLLAGVAGVPHFNLADRIHPNAEGHRLMAETVWNVLSAVL